MSLYYDRDGQPIDLMTWGRRLKTRAEQRVAETTLPNGMWVSTVWLGLDHGDGGGPPLIFETMVFPSKDGPLSELDCERYSTLAQAEAGHAAMVEKYR